MRSLNWLLLGNYLLQYFSSAFQHRFTCLFGTMIRISQQWPMGFTPLVHFIEPGVDSVYIIKYIIYFTLTFINLIIKA